MAELTTVAIVLTPAFEAAQLHSMAQRCHVWLIGTEANLKAAREFWAAFPNVRPGAGVTTFASGGHREPAAACQGILDAVELHHGTASAPTPYPVLEVVGSPLVPSLERELRSLGFSSFTRTANGFCAARQAAT